MVAPTRKNPYPDGANEHGLFEVVNIVEIVSIGISKKDHSIDAALNREALDDLSPEMRREYAEILKILLWESGD